LYDGTTTLTRASPRTIEITNTDGISINDIQDTGFTMLHQLAMPLVINYRLYAILTASSLTGGKLIQIRAIVLEYGE
jgi:hypothetical protein